MAIILDGSIAAASIRTEIAEAVKSSVAKGNRPPGLVAILVGEDGASQTYVGAKKTACDEVGFAGDVRRFAADISEADLLAEIEKINCDETIDGLIVQLPLPKHISEEKVTQAILPGKDVDGFHDINMGKLAKGDETGVKPATPYGITLLMKHYGIEASGKHVVVVGRSNIVGRPMSMLLSAAATYGNATLTLCHSRTKDLASFTRMADILVVALGKPGFVTADMVKNGAVIIDVGTTRVDDPSRKSGWRLRGDVDYDAVLDKVSAITPVPKGVGPMTIAGLMMNTLEVYKAKFA
ncbi:MAG: bifunctional 5,10-methylenetetrahydrofolate dehydrogenase/5,10-methenyltetrahydrofolate cyclohydrolase [Flavobacteriaceae bacterium]|nr:bifunctional 5,10-methylenetetrahydrofolate dehydrogenase/5,10-methenyltetrahydrofolate cyclohydrolase [Flavobacteriaceae bacterium]PHX76485.1 MAG: bifunctional 5,10-methylene-tetrahydrofolate dehydrogenase/5,10-methylene-tetrahydrofolate cyclohydrolase [Flavobacteriales bacterium]